MWLIILLLLTLSAKADYNVTAIAHCGKHYVIQGNIGNESITTEEECVTTPSDWKE
jgi:hypothetical protein